MRVNVSSHRGRFRCGQSLDYNKRRDTIWCTHTIFLSLSPLFSLSDWRDSEWFSKIPQGPYRKPRRVHVTERDILGWEEFEETRASSRLSSNPLTFPNDNVTRNLPIFSVTRAKINKTTSLTNSNWILIFAYSRFNRYASQNWIPILIVRSLACLRNETFDDYSRIGLHFPFAHPKFQPPFIPVYPKRDNRREREWQIHSWNIWLKKNTVSLVSP